MDWLDRVMRLERRLDRNREATVDNRVAYSEALTTPSRLGRPLTPVERQARDMVLYRLDGEYLRLERSRATIQVELRQARVALLARSA